MSLDQTLFILCESLTMFIIIIIIIFRFLLCVCFPEVSFTLSKEIIATVTKIRVNPLKRVGEDACKKD